MQELLFAGLRVSKMSLESGVLVVLSAADWALGALCYLSCVGHSGVPLEGVYRPGTLRLEGHLAFCAKVLPFVWAGYRAVWWHAQVFLQEAIDFVVPLSPFGVFDLLEDGVEKVRANGDAICLACIHADGLWKKRKLDSGEKVERVNCQTNKLPDAFPRAQLEQAGATHKRRCLKCLKTTVKELTCCHCEVVRNSQKFSHAMLTMPRDAAICQACQQALGATKCGRGWFACRGCAQVWSMAAGRGAGQRQWCLNCSGRSERAVGQQTCRNKKCKRKFAEVLVAGQPRKRYCPDCRRL